jgi:hypothetical protein
MASGKLGAVVAVVLGFGYEFVLHSYRWVQKFWGTDLLIAGNIKGWWLLSAVLASVQITIIVGLTYVLLRKYIKVANKLLLISTCADLSVTVILWFFGAVMEDLLKARTATPLMQCSGFLVWIGTLWIAVVFCRFAILSNVTQRPQTE